MTDPAMIHETARTLFAPGTVVELRILNAPRQGTVSGYFDRPAPFVQAAQRWSGKVPGVYATLNPCTPDLLARAANKLKDHVRTTTSDSDIVQRVWFPLDFDPVRPAGISATEAEHAAALERAAACTDWLKARGWPDPVSADSGNGGHGLYRIDLPNDADARTLLQHCLEALAIYFTDSVVQLDVGVFNAARIWKVYGTLACKGDHLPERPHRLSRLLDVPTTLACVSREQLAALAALVPPPLSHPAQQGRGPAAPPFDLAQWITAHHLPVVKEEPWQDAGYRWVLNPCPWNAEHTNGAAFIVRLPTGAIQAGCHHNGCQGNHWHDLRQRYEPGFKPYVPPAALRRGSRHGQTPAPDQDGSPLVIAMDTVTARPIEWLWYPYLAIGKLCILDGDPGVGKTLLATQLAANVSRGHPMPDQQGKLTLSCGAPGVVVFLATEDDLEDTVRPRLDRAGADCAQVKVFNEWQDGTGHRHAFTLADLPYLETVLTTYRPRLVYIDAIQAVLGGKVDANSANQLKQLLDPLAKLAATYRCAILASRHPAKPGQHNVKLIHRGANSMAIIGTARLGLFVEDHPTDKTKVLLLQSKSNAGAIGRTQLFSKKEGVFEWAGVSRITKEEIAGSGRGPNPHDFLEAFFWLESRLEGGLAWPASDIETEAEEQQNLSQHVLKKAKKALGVVSWKGHDKDAAWMRRLPLLPASTPPSSTTSTTSTTSTSLDKSTTCGDRVAVGEEVEEVEEDEEVEVVAVESQEPCFACQGTTFRRNAQGMALCARCYPAPLAALPTDAGGAS